MRKYRFFDTDPTGQAEYDISGQDYKTLLQTCFKYCSTVSFLIDRRKSGQMPILNDLEQWRIPVTPEIEDIYFGEYGHYGQQQNSSSSYFHLYEVRCYRLCTKVEKILLNAAQSIFVWICGWGYNNPADPTFFREDGSAFFTSCVHEGECTLFPIEHENIDKVISVDGWLEFE